MEVKPVECEEEQVLLRLCSFALPPLVEALQLCSEGILPSMPDGLVARAALAVAKSEDLREQVHEMCHHEE